MPPIDSSKAIDLAQAFAGKGANYIGHTGYGWGHVYDIGWSEKLLQLYTQRLLKGQQASMGQTLTDAKQEYYRQSGGLDAFDEKVLQTMIFYGLPMFGIKSGGAGALSGNDEFPGLEVGGAFPPPGVIVRDYNLSATLNNAAIFAKADTAAGDYYALGRNRNTAQTPGEPIQPLFFYSETAPANQSGRGIVLRSATFRLLSQALTFDVAAQVWSGVFSGGLGTRFFVQMVDQAGNVATAHNKGRYYTPGDGQVRTLPLPVCSGQCLFLPMVRR